MRRAAGFTLVEVVVAITVLSLVMLVTVSSLRTLGNTQQTLERTTDRVDEVRTVSTFLRDTMESAVVGSSLGGLSLGGGGREAPYFGVDEHSLEWKSIILFGEAFGGPYVVRVASEEDKLVLRWQDVPGNGNPGDWQESPSRVLVHDLQEFSVSVRPDFGEPWQAGIRRGDTPALVRLRIKSAGRYWPDLVLKVAR